MTCPSSRPSFMTSGPLILKTHQYPSTPSEDFDEWAEGSLGIRFAGAKYTSRTHGSSVSAMSPSLAGSCITLESEDDGLEGLVLPNEPLDFGSRLQRRKESDQEVFEFSTSSVQFQTLGKNVPAEKPVEGVDFFDDIDFGERDVLDTSKVTLNKNVKIKSAKASTETARPAVTSNFAEKSTSSRIPRPLFAISRGAKLDPVYESDAPQLLPFSRNIATTNGSQLLRAKRSEPLLRNNARAESKSDYLDIPTGISLQRSRQMLTKPSHGHLRGDSDPARAKSPSLRPSSRLSPGKSSDMRSRIAARKDIAPPSLIREAASKKSFTKPVRRRNYGDGSELEVFDDLPTSMAKENKFVKKPTNRVSSQSKTLRHQPSNNRLPLSDIVSPPLPLAMPNSPTKLGSTPSFAKDTAASRISREVRMANSGGRPVAPATAANWKAQVVARTQHLSPTAMKKRRKGTGAKPVLIKQMNSPVVKNEKGMKYNPSLQIWEGNESALATFHVNKQSAKPLQQRPSSGDLGKQYRHQHHQHSSSTPSFQSQSSMPMRNYDSPPSAPRAPALISQPQRMKGVQVERGMAFDPQRMCWLKLDPRASDPSNATVDDDEEDPFAGLEDLKDEKTDTAFRSALNGDGQFGAAKEAGDSGEMMTLDEWMVGEEFDLGPEFIRRQREEEKLWRRRVEKWVGNRRNELGHGWRWDIRVGW